MQAELSSQSKVEMLELVGHWLEVLHELVEELEGGLGFSLDGHWRFPAGIVCVAG